MGLAERRAAKHFAENKYPEIKKQIDQAAGFDVPVEVNWDQLAVDDYANDYEENFPKIYFKPLIEALKGICIDDLGRDALKEKLKKIAIGNGGPTFQVTFTMGVLKVDAYYGNVDYWQDRKQQIQGVLEKGL